MGLEEQGLSALRELGYYVQALRRESPEWRSMGMTDRRDEILALVATAARGRYVQEPEVQATAVAEQVIERPDQWPYWVYMSKKKSQEGWFAWHVVRAMVRRLSEEDPEQLTQPTVSEWMVRHLKKPRPARGDGSPKGAKDMRHRVAVLGVSALMEAGLCELTGKTKGGGRSCCDLVAGELGVGWRTVYNAWREYEKRLAGCVDAMIALRATGEGFEPCPEIALEAVLHTALVYRVVPYRIGVAWRKDGKLAKYCAHVEFGYARHTDQGLLKKTY